MTINIVSVLKSKRVQLLCQLFLGGLFIYASLGKVLNISHFAEIISNYKLLPSSMIKITAFLLPWLEFIFGVFLVLNIKPKMSALILSSLLIIFILAITINIIRGVNVNCGCFIKKLNNSLIFHRNLSALLIG